MIKIVAVGKIKEKALKTLIAEYQKRLSSYTKLLIIEVDDEMLIDDDMIIKAIQVEGERILKQIKEREYVILLDLGGEMIDSVTLAKQIQELNTYGRSDITFIIGGSVGVSDKVKARADLKWQLSKLTFTHQHVRLLVLEQIYRAYKINNNETYHK